MGILRHLVDPDPTSDWPLAYDGALAYDGMRPVESRNFHTPPMFGGLPGTNESRVPEVDVGRIPLNNRDPPLLPPTARPQPPLPAPSVDPHHPANGLDPSPQQRPNLAAPLGYNTGSWGWGGPPGPAI
jgi:hypothetical protein